jgi:DNA-binding NarL/FixJ family response regulator
VGTVIVRQRTEIKETSVRRIRVLVVDRHPVIGDAFSAWLKPTPDMIYCGQAQTAAEAFDHITIAQPDVVIVSLSLEDAYGLDLTSQFVAMHPQLRILIYSQYDERIFSERAIEAGAMGYIMKNVDTVRVLEGIRSVMRNETFLSTRMTARLLNKITKGAGAVRIQILDRLTHRELAVLLMMSEGATPQNMADRLKLDRKTVETHRRRVKEKLGFESVSALLHFATQWRHAQGTLLPIPSAESESGYKKNPLNPARTLSDVTG